jgi:hypothetical protein
MEIDYATEDQDPEVVQRNIKLAKERILRALEELISVSVENRIKNGRAYKRILVIFEP